MNHTLQTLRTANKLAREAAAILERLEARHDVKGATLDKLFKRFQRRRDRSYAAADSHFGAL
jgi:hypothetical protein